MTALLAVLRLLQFGAACALCGAALFAFYGRPSPGLARMLRLGAAFGATGALGWLMAQAGVLYDSPVQAFRPVSVWSIVAETGFGAAAFGRLVLFALALVVALVPRVPARLPALATVGTLAAASFAWTGHGGVGDGLGGTVHLVADVAHLLAAAVWIGALIALTPLVLGPDKDAARTSLLAFSGIGPAVVAVLVLTGLVNGWFLVGPGRVLALPDSPYGRLLLFKLAAFLAMLGLAAANRLVLTPRLDLKSLRASLVAETALGFLVLALVAWLGTLPPPIDS
jgi:putative copper resistance protein D